MSKGTKKKRKLRETKGRAIEEELKQKREENRKCDESTFFEDKRGHLSQSLRRKLSKERVAVLTNTPVEIIAKKRQRTQIMKPNPICRKSRLRKLKKQAKNEPTASSEETQSSPLDIWGKPAPTGKTVVSNGKFKIEVEDLKSPVFKHNKKAAEKGVLKDGTQVCHPGASFNPSQEDHQAALKEAHQRHRDDMKEINDVKNKFRKIQRFARKQTWRQKSNENSDSESEEEEGEKGGMKDENQQRAKEEKEEGEKPLTSTAVATTPSEAPLETPPEAAPETPPVAPLEAASLPRVKRGPVRAEDRKTRVQKNKLKRKRAADSLMREKKRNKKFRIQLHQISKLSKQFDENQKEKESKRQKRNELKALNQRPPSLGKYRFSPAFPDVQETSDQSSTLRTLKPSHTAIRNFQKNMERKNVLEPRKRVKPYRKFKIKYYTKKTHKEANDNK